MVSSGVGRWDRLKGVFQPAPGEHDRPFALAQLVYAPGMNIHAYSFAVKKGPGSLMQVAEKVAEEEWNIVATSISEGPTAEYAQGYMVVDFMRTEKSPEDFLRAISSIPSVTSAEHVEPLAIGFLADTSHFPIEMGFGGARGFIFSEMLWKSLFESSYDTMGVDATRTFLYQVGLDFGRRNARWLRERLHYEGEDAIRVLIRQGKALGWWSGTGEADLLRHRLSLKLWQNWEGQYTKEGAGCQAVLGFWDGAVSEALNRTVRFVEVACISKKSEYCEFRLATS